ncbi:MAG: hypothetical protein Tsb0020_05720 [Haliangiales bacterium]
MAQPEGDVDPTAATAMPGAISEVEEWDNQQTFANHLIGRTIGGGFAIRDVIGNGAFGRVYRAEQLSLEREVAVKVLRSRHAENSSVVRRFCDEARAASQLRHPNVVSVYEYGRTDDGLLYIVMELLRGHTVRALLEAHRPLPVARALALFMPILRGLEEAHGVGVIHADLKADNIFVHLLRDGEELVKIIDFGVARIMQGETETCTSVTQTVQVTGTPEYMAPELIEGMPNTAATDIYAAGIMLYELLTGWLPFTSADPIKVLMYQRDEPVMPPSRRCPQAAIPRALEDIVMRALAKDPAERFASAVEFQAALEALPLSRGATSCHRCGADLLSRSRFCPACGASMQVAAQRGDRAARSPEQLGGAAGSDRHVARGTRQIRDIQRDQALGRSASERGDLTTALAALQRAIGSSIRLGHSTLILDSYLSLVAVYEGAGKLDEALRELEECVDLVTMGEPDGGNAMPVGLWQMFLRQAELYQRTGDLSSARRACGRALRRARQCGASKGVDKATTLARALSDARPRVDSNRRSS